MGGHWEVMGGIMRGLWEAKASPGGVSGRSVGGHGIGDGDIWGVHLGDIFC